MVLCLLFVYFQFWDGIQNSVPTVLQIVLSNVSVLGRVVHSNVYGLFGALAMLFLSPTYDFKVLQCFCMTSVILMIKKDSVLLNRVFG